MPTVLPAPEASLPDHFLPALLDVSLAGVLYLAPRCDAAGAVADFTLAYLNPAAQRLLALPAQPGGTCRQRWPRAAAGLLALYHHGEPYEVDARPELPGRLAARRVGEGLLLSLSSPSEADAEASRQQAQLYHLLEQAQRTTEAQRQQLTQLFMQAPAAICVLGGKELVFELVNPLCQQAFRGRALLGQPLLAALPELGATSLPAVLARVYATGETYRGEEVPLRLTRPEGGEPADTYWSLTYLARRDAEGRIDGILSFAYEVTAQVSARQAQTTVQARTQALADQLQRTNEQLRQANADLDNFVHMASHDLKAPITNIEGLLHSLHQELALPPAEADTATVLRLMQDSVRRFQRTIHYLADMSKWQRAATEPARPVPLAELVESVRLDLAPLLHLSGGHIVLAADSCPVITFSEKQLRGIVFNLLSNALKYRSPARAPYVQVRCANPTGREAVLEVEDNGLGLSPAQQAQLFGMFQRQHDHVEGSGVGLYLVKKALDQAGGRVEVRSQPGVGSVFRVSLPQ